MTHAEQHKIITEVRDYAHKMKRHELDDFEIFVKRDKDDEDLDLISQKRLMQLYDFYVVHKDRST